MNRTLLEVQGLTVGFETDAGLVTVVDDVSFSLRAGEVVGLVGESGCGKSVTALSLLRLVPSPPGRMLGGHVLFGGFDLVGLPAAQLRDLRGRRISMIFQEPMTALSPLVSVGRQLAESVLLHRDLSRAAAMDLAADWLGRVGVPDPAHALRRLPHELSGGMRQRVMIAMALMLEPEVIIADEPTTALDVTVQAQIFDLLLRARSANSTILFITHDMGAVWEICDRVMIMYAARIVEQAPVKELFARPAHPYTRGLLKSMPSLQKVGARLESIPGSVPTAGRWPAGCRFSDRCPMVIPICREREPALREIREEHTSACHRAGEVSPP